MVIPGFAEAFAHAEALDIVGRVHKTFDAAEYGKSVKHVPEFGRQGFTHKSLFCIEAHGLG